MNSNRLLLLLISSMCSIQLTAQVASGTYDLSSLSPAKNSWLANPGEQKLFLENKGQYDGEDHLPNSNIKFGVDNLGYKIYFTPKGLTYRFDVKEEIVEKKEKQKKEKERERERERERAGRLRSPKEVEEEIEREKEERENTIIKQYTASIEWQNANPQAEIIAEGQDNAYFNFEVQGSSETITNVKGYRKIIYKNIYPGISIEYVFHEKEGIKYSLLLEPFADASLVQFKVISADVLRLDKEGNLILAGGKYKVIEHAPVTFYADSKKAISSAFRLHGNIVSFNIGEYDHSRPIVIDPWVNLIGATMTTNNKAFDIERDALGNVYAYGGFQPYKLIKYSPAGTLIWNYSTAISTYYGDLAVTPTGESYISEGCCSGVRKKISTAGVLQWQVSGGYETWNTILNKCNPTQAVVSGYNNGPYGALLAKFNQTNGSYTTTTSPTPTEFRSICFSPNGNLYGITVPALLGGGPQIVATTPNLTAIYTVPHNFTSMTEAGPLYTSSTLGGFAGQNAIVADRCFIYLSNGATLEKRSISNGALLASVTIPNGAAENNSGIALDSCGNVYVGSQTGIYKFSTLLVQTGFALTNGAVYGISLGSNGEILACGLGFVGAFAMQACNPVSCTIPTLTVTSQNTICTAALGSATATVSGAQGTLTYSWSNGQTTQTATNLTAGTYTVSVTEACSTLTATVTVGSTPSPAFNIPFTTTVATCGMSNGSLSIGTVTGGTAPYSYNFNSTGYSASTTFNNISAGVYNLSVKDQNGCIKSTQVTISNSNGPTGVASTIASATCGNNNGSVSLGAVTGGTGPYIYNFNNGGYSNLTTYQNLAGGNYPLLIKDASNCIYSTSIVIPSEGSPTSIEKNITNAICGNNFGSVTLGSTTGGTAPFTYNFNSLGYSSATTYSSLTPGTYTLLVKDFNGCILSTSVLIGSVPGPSSVALQIENDSCSTNTGDVVIGAVSGGTGPFTYSFNGAAFGSVTTFNNLASGSYIVKVKDQNNCILTTTVEVGNIGAPVVVAFTDDPLICPGATSQLEAIVQEPCAPATYPCSGPSSNVTVGLGTMTSSANSNQYSPFYGSLLLSPNRRQYIYSADEIIAAGAPAGGNISTISFNVTQLPSSGTAYVINIKIGCTDLVEWPANDFDFITGLFPVKTAFNFTPVLGWNTITLDNAYHWDGSSNLIIEVCSDGGALYPTVVQVSNTAPRYYSLCRQNSYSTDPTGCLFQYGDRTLERPNMQFNICAAIPSGLVYSWTPSSSLSNSTIPNPIASPLQSTSYTVNVYSINNPACIGKSGISVAIDTTNKAIAWPDTSVCAGTQIQLGGTVTGPTTFIPLNCGTNATACASPATIAIGSGTNGGSSYSGITPYYGYFMDHRIQILYRASELTAAGMNVGTISSLTFNVKQKNSSASYNGFTIKMGCTSRSDLSNGLYETGLTTVLNPTNYTPVVGLNTHSLNNTYDWDGTSNIIIEICFDNAAYTLNDPVYYSTTAFRSVLYRAMDNNAGCNLTSPYMSYNRPNISFGYCASPPVVLSYKWSPATAVSDSLVLNPTALVNANTNYILTVSGTKCTVTDTATVLVTPAPTATITGSDTICAGSTGTLTVDFTGDAPWSFAYTDGTNTNTVGAVTSTPYTISTATPGTYSITSISNGACVGAGSGTATLTNFQPIVLSSVNEVCGSGNSDYTVQFTISGGTPGSYTVTPAGSGTISPNAPYIFTSSPIPSGDSYSFTISDVNNCSPQTVSGVKNCACSVNATLTGGGAICSGASVPVTVTLTGMAPWDLTYAINGVPQPMVSNINTSPYVFNATTPGSYTVISVSNATCSGSGSGTVIVSNNPSPTASVTGGGAICAGSSTTVNVGLTGQAPWSFTYTDGTTTTVVNNQMTSPYVINAGSAGSYSIPSLSDNNCPGTSSGSANVTIKPSPQMTQHAAITTCPGSTITTSFSSSPAGSTYSWTNSNTAIGIGGSGSGPISPWTAPANNTGSVISGNISVVPTLNGCPGPAMTFAVNIDPTPVMSAVTNINVCGGQTISIPAFASTPPATSFTWTNSDTAVGLPLNGSGNIQSYTAPNNSGSTNISSTVSVRPFLNGCEGAPVTFSITVKPNPVVNQISNITVCPGEPVAVTFGTTPQGGAITWTNSNSAIGLPLTGSTNIPSYNAPANTTGSTITGSLEATTTINGCSSPAMNFTISIKPTPVANTVNNITACAGTTVPQIIFGASPSSPPSTFTWTNSDPSIGLAGNGSGNINSFTATGGSSVQSSTVTYAPQLNGCTGTSSTFTITVNPTPSANAPSSINACAGTPVQSIPFAGTPSNVQIGWSNSNTQIGLAGSGNTTTPLFTATNTTGAAITGIVTLTPTANGCTGPTTSFNITVNPSPPANAGSDITICHNATGNIGAPPVTGVTYSWTPSSGLSNSNISNPSVSSPNTSSSPVTTTYTMSASAAGCVASDVVAVTVSPTDNSSFTYSMGTYCSAGTDPTPTITGISGGIFTSSPNGLVMSSTTGTIDLSASMLGSYTVIYTSNGSCPSSSTYTVSITNAPSSTFSYNGPYCSNSTGTANPVFTNGSSAGQFSSSPSGLTFSNAATGTIDLSATNAGTYTITNDIAAASGCPSSSYSTTLTINQTPVVTASNNGPVCNGASLNLTSSPAANGAYTWSGPNGFTSTSPGPVINPVNSGAAGTYSVVVTSNNCVSQPAITNVIVNPLPSASISGGGTICSGSSATINVGMTGTPPWNLTYTDGSSNINANNITSSPYTITSGSSGNYSVTSVTDNTGCTGTTSGTASITVNPLPTATVTGGGSVCPGGDPANINFNFTGSGPWTFTYSNGSSSSTLTTSASPYIASSSSQGNYTVTGVTDATGCQGTSSGSAAVVVSPTPTATVSGSQTICPNSNGQFNISLTGSSPWNITIVNGNDTTTATSNTSPYTHVVNDPGTYTVIQVSDASTCTGSSTGSATISFSPPLALTSTTPLPVCEGQSSAISTSCSGGNGAYSYTWTPSSSLSSTTGSSVIATPLTTTTYTVIVRDGCTTSPDTAYSIVAIKPRPDVAFVSDKDSICIGECVTFIDSTITSGSTVSYSWNFGDGSISNLASPAGVCFKAAGVYTVSLNVVSDGCARSLSKPNMICVSGLPEADFEFGPQPATMIDPRICFTDKSDRAVSWEWTFGDKEELSNSSFEQNPCHAYSDTGTYCVNLKVTNEGGCTDNVSYCLKIAPDFTFYIPNAFSPNGDGLNDDFGGTGTFINKYSLLIFDRWGNKVFESRDLEKRWKGNVEGVSDDIAMQDVYVYLAQIVDSNNKIHKIMGKVTIIK